MAESETYLATSRNDVQYAPYNNSYQGITVKTNDINWENFYTGPKLMNTVVEELKVSLQKIHSRKNNDN